MLTSAAGSAALVAIAWFVRAALRRLPGGPAATLRAYIFAILATVYVGAALRAAES